jgi:hypothetical protein
MSAVAKRCCRWEEINAEIPTSLSSGFDEGEVRRKFADLKSARVLAKRLHGGASGGGGDGWAAIKIENCQRARAQYALRRTRQGS